MNDAGIHNMSDLISRQAAIDELKKYIAVNRNPNHDARIWEEGMNCAVTVIGALPSAQPEIIRCKDCKHFHYDVPYVIQGIPVLGHEVCDFWGDGCKTSENGFCSYAERGNDDEGRSN